LLIAKAAGNWQLATGFWLLEVRAQFLLCEILGHQILKVLGLSLQLLLANCKLPIANCQSSWQLAVSKWLLALGSSRSVFAL